MTSNLENSKYKNNKILIVDDHVIIRRGMKFILESNFGIKEFLETESCQGILEIMKKEPVSHIILDMQLNDGNVISILSELISLYPDVKILVYTMSPEEIFGARILSMGVSGFLNKQASEKEVIQALQHFFDNSTYISPSLKELMDQKKNVGKKSEIYKELSERELEVMNFLIKGLGIKDISGILNIKSSTVATFKARIFNKLGVANIIDLKNLSDLYNFKSTAE